MTQNYEVTVTSPSLTVNVDESGAFSAAVNYEAPTRSIQHTNLILDDFSAGFDGATKIFPLTVNGVAYSPSNEQQLIIQVNGVVLRPAIDYTISGSTITFVVAPTNSQIFSGVALQTIADITRTVVFHIDNGSNDITTGSKGVLTLDVAGTIEEWRVLSDQTGIIAVDIEKSTFNDYPNNFSSIVGSEYPTLINQNKRKDDDLTTWTKNLALGDVLKFVVLSCTGIQKCSVFLKLKL
jgi:hypothetical protein